MITLSAPAKSGYKKEFETTDEARAAAAGLLDVTVSEMVECDVNGLTYCYDSQEAADDDSSGAYTVKYGDSESEQW